jgi:hypothetical protein
MNLWVDERPASKFVEGCSGIAFCHPLWSGVGWMLRLRARSSARVAMSNENGDAVLSPN